ncbi:hypothetical protein ACS0TY_013099 [Phlomoides rotata]
MNVKGCDNVKQELEEVVEYIRNPSKFMQLEGKLPKFKEKIYSRDQIDEMRVEWAECIQREI